MKSLIRSLCFVEIVIVEFLFVVNSVNTNLCVEKFHIWTNTVFLKEIIQLCVVINLSDTSTTEIFVEYFFNDSNERFRLFPTFECSKKWYLNKILKNQIYEITWKFKIRKNCANFPRDDPNQWSQIFAQKRKLSASLYAVHQFILQIRALTRSLVPIKLSTKWHHNLMPHYHYDNYCG